MTFRHQTVPALELNRSHIGQTVQVTTEEWTIVGRLNRVDNEDNLDFGERSPMEALRAIQTREKLGIRREIRCWLTIGPWRGEVYPAQAVVVEYEEEPDVIEGSIVVMGEIEGPACCQHCRWPDRAHHPDCPYHEHEDCCK